MLPALRDAVAGMMWFTGLFALLVVPGQLWGRIYTWGMDDKSDPAEPEPTPEVLWILIPAAGVVMAIGTIAYVH
jgi:hypothetical protein